MFLQVNNVKTEIIISSDPKEAICEAVEKLKADLLVMGSRAFGPIKRYSQVSHLPLITIFIKPRLVNKNIVNVPLNENRMFLGSVSNYCTNHAQCPVIIVKGSS